MAGAIDLFSGDNSLSGVNLFKVDKNPLEQLDQGLVSMVEQADGLADAFLALIQQIVDAILGGAGKTLADLADFFLNLPGNIIALVEKLTGLNIDEGPVAFLQSVFLKLEAATGLNWDEGPISFLSSLFAAIISQLERLTGLNIDAGPALFMRSLFTRIQAATGLNWLDGPLEFLSSLFESMWHQLNLVTELVWDEGPVAFVASLFNKVITELERLTGLEINSGVAAFLNSLWLRLNTATQLVWDQGPLAFLTSLFNTVIYQIEQLTGLEINSGIGPFLQSVWDLLEDATELIWDSGPLVFIQSFFNKLWDTLNDLTGLAWDQGPLAFLNSLVTWVVNNIFNPNGAIAVFNAVKSFVSQFFDPTKGPLSGIFLLIKAVSDFFFQFFPWLRPDEPAVSASATTAAATIADNIPTTTALAGAITGKTGSDSAPLGLGIIQQWARDIENTARQAGDAFNGFIGDLLSGTIPIGMLNDKSPNILVQGTFASAATIASNSGGWAWDNTYSATPTGGSAKVAANGSLQELFSSQTISVGPGDKIEIKGKVRTGTGTAAFIPAAGRQMVLSVVPYAGTTRLAGAAETHVVSTRTLASSTGFSDMTGLTVVIGGTAAAGEVALDASVTSIQVRLAVTANAGAMIWFDDISVIKTGLVQQGLVDGLPGLNDVANGYTQSGSNLLPDPKIDYPRLWKQSGLAVSTAFSNSTSQSLEFSGNGTARSFYWPTNSLGLPYAIGTWPDRIYYVECYVYLPATNPNTTAQVAMFSQATILPFSTGTNISPMTFSAAGTWSTVTLSNPVRGAWNKLSGYFKVPTLRNGFTAGITFTAATTHKLYVDDLVIQDVTDSVTANDKLYGRPTPADIVAQNKVDGLTGLSSTVGGFSGQIAGLNTTVGTLDNTVNGTGGLVKNLYGPTGVIANKINIDAIPTNLVGSQLALVPVTGSGARVARLDTSLSTSNFFGQPSIPALTATFGPQVFGVWGGNYYQFFDTVFKRTSDIAWNASTGSFTVSTAAWYLVEVGFAVDASSGFAGSFNVTPIVVVNGQLVKAGSDAWGSYGFGFGGKSRYSQSSFIIYVNAGGTVQAGYDAAATYPNFFRGQGNGAYTNFSISMMNRTAE